MELQTIVEDWGLIDYQEALDRQLQRLVEVQANPHTQYLLFCSHPPVATLGRKTQPVDWRDWQGQSVEVQRGGRVTYHGPNQLVVYPILNLSAEAGERPRLKSRDLHGYLRLLEDVVIATLKEFDIAATNSPGEDFLSSQAGDVEPTGVWVGRRKICSMGIGVKKWVTFHGLALNVQADQQAFQGLRPCGFSAEVMTSMEEVTSQGISRQEVSETLRENLEEALAWNE